MLKIKQASVSVVVLVVALLLTVFGAMLQPTVTAFALSGEDASISDILNYQLADGGWRKSYTNTSGEWAKSTIDNGATYTEIRRLAAEYTKTNNSTYSNAAKKGINFLINMQYANGGWPQIYNASGYHTHITYNDDAMINVMILLDEVANKKGDFAFVDSTLADKAKTAVTKGVECILNTQVVVNGKLTVWGQQHDSVTLKPAGARAYEVSSLCSKESVGIVNFLKTRPSTTQIAASIKAAEDWFVATKLTGIKVVNTGTDVVVVSDPNAAPIWARFYEIGTNRPIFVGRDGIVKYNLADIELERRTGYSWYGNWPSKIVAAIPVSFPTIEAENYSSMSGVKSETCGEGGQNVGYIENGDYIVFNNIALTGATGFEARVATNGAGGNIEIRLGSPTGTLIGTCAVTGTGGWQTYATKSTTVSGATGTHNVYLVFKGGSGYLFNFNWFKFK